MRHCFLLILLFLNVTADTSVAADSPVSDVQSRLSSGQLTKIVCFGDSITGAYYHSGGQRAWCDMLGVALQLAEPAAKVQMINAGLSGHTTVQAVARIDRDVIAHQPNLVVVMFGMNDVTRVPIALYEANLKTIIQKCRAVGAAVVLCTPNAVVENTARPNAKLAAYSDVVRKLAHDQQLPLADCFQDFARRREQDPLAWSLLMSDDIHPNMTGHLHFAELITKALLNKDVSLVGTAAPADALQHTFEKLARGETVKLVAMAPFDSLLPKLLQQHHFPDAKFDVTVWPTENMTVAQLAEWGKRIRGLEPDLVVPAVPESALSTDATAWIQDYEWALNYSFAFGGRPWDVVPALPLHKPTSPDKAEANAIARRIVLGKDVRFIEWTDADTRSADAILAAWIDEQAPRLQPRSK